MKGGKRGVTRGRGVAKRGDDDVKMHKECNEKKLLYKIQGIQEQKFWERNPYEIGYSYKRTVKRKSEDNRKPQMK